MYELKLPQFGMGMTDGTIVKWYKAEGDTVTTGELLCEIEAAKTNVEYESPVTGTLINILVQVDENVAVNTPIANFSIEGEVAHSEVSRDDVTSDDVAPPLDEAAEAPKRISPLAQRIAEQNGVALEKITGTGPSGRIMKVDIPVEVDPVPKPVEAVQIEPRARKAARDLGIDLDTVKGSGPAGRILAEDVLTVNEKSTAAMESPASEAVAPQTVPDATAAPDYAEIKHSMMRRTIARRLTESKQTVPHFYLKAACQIDALLAARELINSRGQEKVSVNDLVIRSIAIALKEVPEANVVWDDKAMRQYSHVDIAVAVATPRGLVTPVLRRADEKSIRQISAEVKELAGRGREGKLKPEEYQGGTTSVSNLGMFGVEEFSAIINPPQSTIFAVGAGMQQIVPLDGKAAVATIMKVTVSIDHRAVDGAVGAQLLAAFKRNIEDPLRILA